MNLCYLLITMSNNNHRILLGILVASVYLFESGYLNIIPDQKLNDTSECEYCYKITEPYLEVSTPKGFKISILADPSILLFEFHGAKNRKLFGNETGDFKGETIQKHSNRFIYENTEISLSPGDVLYYWMYIQYKGYGDHILDKKIIISSAHFQNILPIPDSSTGSCKRSKTLVKGVRPCKGQLIFEENFDSLNWTKWSHEIKIPLFTEGGDFVSFQNRPENCYVNSGQLHIVPNLLTQVPGYNNQAIREGELDFGSRCTGVVDVELECKRETGLHEILPPVISAKINTKQFFSFRYGRIEVRAKLPKGDWLFPQILLEPYGQEYGINGYASGQMRIAFIRGNEILETNQGTSINGQQLEAGVILSIGDSLRDIRLRSIVLPNHLGHSFHTYTMIWTDENIELAIDAKTYATIDGGFNQVAYMHNISYAKQWDRGTYMAPFDKEFFISLGVSAGGIADFPDDCVTRSSGLIKPWENDSPKAELKFWDAREDWHHTWEGERSGMTVDYIRVWAL